MARSSRWLATSQWLLLLVITCVAAFKEHDFKKCHDSAFCQRNRGQPGGQFVVQQGSVQLSDDQLVAAVKEESSGASFSLQISAYHGILRIQMDEAPTSERVHVSDVLLDNLSTVAFEPATTETDRSTGHSFVLGEAQIAVNYRPLQVTVSVAGQPAIQFNGNGHLLIEHRRAKKEGDPDGWWEETFKSHKDSKPKGPQSIAFDLDFAGFSHVYGLPERATALALKPTVGEGITSEPYRLYNLDVFEYLTDSPFGLYGSVPLMIAHRAGLTVGAFWLNAAEMYVDVGVHDGGTRTQWIAESGVLDLFLLLGPTPQNVTAQYAYLTGTTAMPQMFSIGYHQCRWNYKDEKDVAAVNAGFDAHAMPCDVIWLDIEHTDGKRYMTWDKEHFPQPAVMQNDVASVGRKMVTIVDPHVKRDSGYALHNEATRRRYYVRDATGKDFEGWCWPGSSSYLDVTNPEIRDWWAQHFSLASYHGSTSNLYIWNDMNEPSVFNGPEITMQKDSLHHNDVEHRDVHNVYGLYYHMATADGLRRRGWETFPHGGDRPFVLSRAFFAGTQRVGPIWTGDNAAHWEHLRVSVPMLLTLNIAGISNSGADVGGFFGNPEPELLMRWYQAAVLSPFLRGHAHLEAARREPWLFGEEVGAVIRAALRERYALLPYLYTLFREANLTGAPIMRPMWYEFPAEERLFAHDAQFMLGPALLAAPVLEKGVAFVEVDFPRGERFFEAATGREVVPAEVGTTRIPVDAMSIPRFYRGGHIVPRRERPRRSTAAQRNDPYTLVVALDASGAARGELYADDGSSFAFLAGKFLRVEISFAGNLLDWHVAYSMLAYQHTVERIVVLGIGGGKWTAVEEVSRRELDVSSWGEGGEAIMIRQPGTIISENWRVRLTKAD